MAGPEGASETDAQSTRPGSNGSSGQDSTAGEPKRSGLGVIVHSFFVVPLLIAVLAVLVIAGVSILSSEPADALDYLAMSAWVVRRAAGRRRST